MNKKLIVMLALGLIVMAYSAIAVNFSHSINNVHTSSLTSLHWYNMTISGDNYTTDSYTPTMINIRGFCMNSDNEVFDVASFKIIKFNNDGSVSVGTRELAGETGLCVIDQNDDLIFALDSVSYVKALKSNNYSDVFPDYEYWEQSGGYNLLAVDVNNDIWAVNANSRNLVFFDSSNSYASTIYSNVADSTMPSYPNQPFSLDRFGNLWLIEGSNRIHFLNYSDNYARSVINHGVSGIRGVATDKKGDVYFISTTTIYRMERAENYDVTLFQTGFSNLRAIFFDGNNDLFVVSSSSGITKIELATDNVLYTGSGAYYFGLAYNPLALLEYSCTPDWVCVGYENCTGQDLALCNDVLDNNDCGDKYLGNYSEFAGQACDYSYDEADISRAIIDTIVRGILSVKALIVILIIAMVIIYFQLFKLGRIIR